LTKFLYSQLPWPIIINAIPLSWKPYSRGIFMLLSRFRAVLAALVLLACATSVSAADCWVYFGTYTGKDGSKGIYRSKLDGTTGKLSEPELAAEAASPSFLAIHPNGKHLYAVGETGGKDGGAVLAYDIDAKTGALTKLNESTTGGSGPCHISVSPKGDYATVGLQTGFGRQAGRARWFLPAHGLKCG
jgi:6-phosphogluconolactonase